MKQLSGLDASFLQLERGTTMLHGASLAIYDPSTAPGGFVRFKDILKFFTSRIMQFPQFRRRLVRVPLALDRPYWVEDPEIDVEFHVRHIALPQPGDWRQLCIQVARLHSRRLDFSMPPWEAYVIEGLDKVQGVTPGSFAIYMKMHHSAADGELRTEMLKALHSLKPTRVGREPVPDVETADDYDPTYRELCTQALVNNVAKVPAVARLAVRAAGRLAKLGTVTLQESREKHGGYGPAMRALLTADRSARQSKLPSETRFGRDISVHRVFDAVGLPLADFKLIRRHVPEATVNNQFLALVGGALREYLENKDELPDESMLALVPLSLRGTDKSQEGNQIAFTSMSVHSDIADPLERLRTISDEATRAKQTVDMLGKEFTRDLVDVMPNLLVELLARYVKTPGVGLTVSNVRGPDTPLYMAGASLVSYVPISMVLNGVGLNITGFSYAGTMWVGAVACREMVPDPAYLVDCMRRSFAALKQAAQREPKHSPPTKAIAPRLPGPKSSQRKRRPHARPRTTRRRPAATA